MQDIYKGVWHLQLQQGWAIFDIFKALYQIRQNKHDCEQDKASFELARHILAEKQ